MKPNDVRRGIQSRHARVSGDAPRLGNVSRLREGDPQEPVSRGRRRGKSGMSASRRRVVIAWSGVLIALTMAVIGGFMLFWLRTRGQRIPSVAAGVPLVNERIVSKFDSPKEDEILALTKRALATRDPGRVAERFRMGTASSAEVVDFLAKTEDHEGKVDQFLWLGSIDANGMLIEGVVMNFSGKESGAERIALFTPDDAGVWKVDFDAYARSSHPSWSELIGGRAGSSEVRVLVREDTYYNGPFIDDKQWVCYGMYSPEAKALLPEGGGALKGYCRVGSAQAKAFEKILADGVKASRATLEISNKEGAEPQQFEILRVLAEDWVLAGTPYDARFE